MPTGVYPRHAKSLADRFWAKVQKGEGCWEWDGCRTARGYGRLTAGRRGDGQVRAHRVAYELTYGPIPDGMEVCHTCDNPPCVNPSHLFAGTRTDNMRDCVAKGRINTHAARAARALRRVGMSA